MFCSSGAWHSFLRDLKFCVSQGSCRLLTLAARVYVLCFNHTLEIFRQPSSLWDINGYIHCHQCGLQVHSYVHWNRVTLNSHLPATCVACFETEVKMTSSLCRFAKLLFNMKYSSAYLHKEYYTEWSRVSLMCTAWYMLHSGWFCTISFKGDVVHWLFMHSICHW